MDKGIHFFEVFCGDDRACIKVFDCCGNRTGETGSIKFINRNNTAFTCSDIVPRLL